MTESIAIVGNYSRGAGPFVVLLIIDLLVLLAMILHLVHRVKVELVM